MCEGERKRKRECTHHSYIKLLLEAGSTFLTRQSFDLYVNLLTLYFAIIP